MELFTENELAAEFAIRFAHRVQQAGDSSFGKVQDSIIGGLVAALAVRVGHAEAAKTLDLAMMALGDEEVVENLNANIRKVGERRK